MALPQIAEEYDIIFCGGGSSACVAAGRLSTAIPKLRILILEAGPHTNDMEEQYMPGKYLTHLRPDSATMSFHAAHSNDHLDGRPFRIPSARCVGGGSNVNWMMYTRASASDYDDWEKLGNPGWGYSDLLPLMKKVETYQISDNLPTHGYSGPLKVSFGDGLCNVAIKFLEMAAVYDKQRESSASLDANEFSVNSINKYTTWPKWIDASTGRRSTPTSYIYEQATETGLYVAAGCRVKRVVIRNGRADGVEFVYDVQVHPDANQDTHFVRATNLVVLSAGAFGSPTILERSGVGPKPILDACGIEVVVDLPGVGESYHDHAFISTSYLASEDAETLDELYSDDPQVIAPHLEQWKTSGKGSFARNPIDAGIKYRPSVFDLESIGPEFVSTWKTFFEQAPDKAVFWAGISNGQSLPDTSGQTPPKFFSIISLVYYPVSRGRVHIKSSDVYDPIDFNAAIAKDPADVAVLRWMYKKVREFGRRHPFYRGELGNSHPVFPETSNGRIRSNVEPVPFDNPDIQWSKEDDEIIDKHIRSVVSTSCHSLGTCPMKPREQNGVVDPFLNVYGVQNLKIADLSIAPENVGSNTNSTALVIGEKAAIIIARELGLEL